MILGIKNDSYFVILNHAKTRDIKSLKCQKNVKEVSTVVKCHEIVSYLQ